MVKFGFILREAFSTQEYFDTASARPTADHLPSTVRDHADDFPLAGTA
jgi:hypothetical protein